MPVLSRDRLSTPHAGDGAGARQDARRAPCRSRQKDGQGRLRTAPKGFMQEIVDKLNLRSVFETEEVRDKLKMAGLRGQAPLVAYMFFRVAMPIIIAFVALLYLFVLADYDYPALVKIGLAVGAGYIGFYVPNMFIENLVQRRQTSIKNAFPDALDMLLICVQSGMSVEAAFQKVVGRGRRPVAGAGRGAVADHRRAVLPAGPPPGFREPRQAHGHPRHQGGGDGAHPGRALRHARRAGAARDGARRTATCAWRKPRRRPPPCRPS